jgi:hypothetical protein
MRKSLLFSDYTPARFMWVMRRVRPGLGWAAVMTLYSGALYPSLSLYEQIMRTLRESVRNNPVT